MVMPFLNLLTKENDAEYYQNIINGPPGINFSIKSMLDYLNYYFSKMILDDGKQTALMVVCLAVVVLFFLRNFTRYLAIYYVSPVLNAGIRDMRMALYQKILVLPISFFSEERKGDIISKMTADVQEMKYTMLVSIEAIFKEPLTILIYFVALITISPQLTLFVVIMLPLAGLVIGRIGKSLRKTSDKVQNRLGLLFSIIEETLSGLRIIKAFSAEIFSTNKFKKLNQEYFKLSTKVERRRDLSAPLGEFMAAVVMATVMWFGGNLVLKPDHLLSGSAFVFFIIVFSQIIPPAKAIATAYFNIQKGAASASRMMEILDADNVVNESPNPISKTEFKEYIEYRNVSFAYGKEPVLKNINIKIEKGKTVAFIGQSGAGKSTLADLLPRFYDTSSGEVLVDGISVRDMKLSDLRKMMGIVTQESILFNETVFNNIAFGTENAKEEDVIAAAKVANAHEFIMQMENGYQTEIGDRGLKLSGGQRQRLSIARAVFKNPPILILDEATSALDTESERLVQDALLKLMQNRTSIVIAHRFSTIQHADEIVVMDKGEIAERGTHSELILNNGIYKKLYELQLFL